MGQINYTLKIDADIQNVQEKLNALKSSLTNALSNGTKIDLSSSLGSGLEKITEQLDKVKQKANQPIKSESGFSSLETQITNISRSCDDFIDKIDKLREGSRSEKFELLPEDTQAKLQDYDNALKKVEDSLQKAAKSATDFKSKEAALNQQLAVAKEDSQNYAKSQKDVTKTNKELEKNKADINEIMGATGGSGNIDTRLQNLISKRNQLQATSKDSSNKDEIDTINNQIAQLSKLNTTRKNLMQTLEEQKAKTESLRKVSEESTKTANKMQNSLNTEKAAAEASQNEQLASSYDKLIETAQRLGVSMEGVDTTYTAEGFEQLKQKVEEAQAALEGGINQGLDEERQKAQQAADANKDLGNKVKESKDEFIKQNDAASDVEGLKSRLTYFFSLTSAVRLFGRALRSAFEEVKALDKAMTETAVVTNYSISDMWNQMPTYTKTANELGATIQGTYETMTLFYQQGLKTNEVFEVGTETMKMARIAGLEYSDATDRKHKCHAA